MEINLADIFQEFIETADKESKDTFNKYFLGSETQSPISLSEYIDILKETLKSKTNIDYRRLSYTRTNTTNYIHSPVGLFYKPTSHVGHSFHITKTAYPGKYPDITLTNYEYYTGIVFLLHKEIKEYSEFDILNLAIKWYDYSVKLFLGVSYPTYIYRYANKSEIYHSYKKLNSRELKNLKIYKNHIFGKDEIAYE